MLDHSNALRTTIASQGPIDMALAPNFEVFRRLAFKCVQYSASSHVDVAISVAVFSSTGSDNNVS